MKKKKNYFYIQTRNQSQLTTFERILPYKLGITITSNCCGRETSCMDALSTIISFRMIPEPSYSFAISRHVFKNKPSPSFLLYYSSYLAAVLTHIQRYVYIALTSILITDLHDVGLVDTGNLFTVVSKSKIKCETCDTFCLSPSNNLQGLNNTRE